MARRLPPPPPFSTTLVGVIGIFPPFFLATFKGRVGIFTQVSVQEFFHMGVILPLEGLFDGEVRKIIVRMGPSLPL